MAAAAKKTGPFRNAVFLLTVRNRLADKLRSDLGLTWAEAFHASRELDADTIEQAATVANNGPAKALGDGGILQFILDFLSSAQFQQLLQLLLSLFKQTALTTPVPTEAPAQG